MLEWFDSRQAHQLGIELADFLASKVPAASLTSKNERTLSKLANALAEVHRRAHKFRSQHSLNFYKRARLMNAFQWRLIEIGYDQRLAEEWGKALVRSL